MKTKKKKETDHNNESATGEALKQTNKHCAWQMLESATWKKKKERKKEKEG